jgi:hypothetical protein
MELSGLEPATSWVRSSCGAGTTGANRHEADGLRSPARVLISGYSRVFLTAGCPGALFDETNITGHELEPMITVGPADRRNIIATWKQDVGPNATRSDLIASSQDGGKTWTRTTIPGLTVCTGGTADLASDPWVSAGGHGTVYFGGLAADLSTAPPTTAVVASHSGDGGSTWPSPATVAPPL